MDEATHTAGTPLIDYAVAVWVGMPDEELARGLREGWIRRPPGAGEDFPGETAPPGTTSPAEPGAPEVRSWLARLDASLDAAALDAIWQEAGADDAQRSASLARFVAQSMGMTQDASFDARRIESALAACDGEARVVRLLGRSGVELEALAREDGGVRRALVLHSPWALSGERSVLAMADPTGRFDRFDPDTGEQLLSDGWLADRARHASWLGRDDTRTVPGDGWRFVDRADPAATVELLAADGAPTHQVIFARDDGDTISGGATTDRAHGGRGDDVLRGRAGDDLLEGGGGDDLLLGGSGHDELAGGRGDDELDGGTGGDRLEGGGGDDELAGGRGGDLLRGGGGNDAYVFEDGDGDDIVEDDGGTLRIDEVVIGGTMQRDGERWRSADGRVTFALDSTSVGGGATGALRVAGEGGDTVTLVGWRQGRFGITLEGLDDEPPESGDDEVGALFDAPAPADALSAGAVDWRALRAALAERAVPQPAAADAVPVAHALPTQADVADALAAVADAGDAMEIAIAADAWSRTPGAWWREAALPVPPDTAPRSTSAW